MFVRSRDFLALKQFDTMPIRIDHQGAPPPFRISRSGENRQASCGKICHELINANDRKSESC